MDRLHPCPDCARHVRSSERACPFCGAALSLVAAPSLPGSRLGRAAIFAFRTSAVIAMGTLAACGNDRAPQEETIMQPYGAPPNPPTPPEPPTPPTTPDGPTLPPPVAPDDTIAQPYGAPPLPEPTPVPPEEDPDEQSPPTHDHERGRRPPRTIAVPAYGIAPDPSRLDPSDFE